MVEMVDTLINGRWNLKLPEHRAARPEWKTGWEKARLDHMHDNLGPADHVLYIGAEEGEMPALLQMWGAEVWLVEPNELVWPNIRAIWDANGLAMPYGIFVGFCGRQTSQNYMDGKQHGWPDCAYGPIIGDHGFKELRDPGGRPVVTVDAYPRHRDIEVISMDVEGAEWEVLQGAERTIDRERPRIYLSLHPEFLIDQYGKYSYEVRRWLIDKGYRETLLDFQHEAHFYYEPA